MDEQAKSEHRMALELCWAIEKLPASEQQTALSIQAAALARSLEHRPMYWRAERIDALEQWGRKMRSCLVELAALVRGESPMLLDEDSGGDGFLSLDIDTLLEAGGKLLGRQGEGA